MGRSAVYIGGYTTQPYAFNRLTVGGRPITKAATTILSAIYSIAGKHSSAQYSYRAMAEKYDLSKSTVARCIKNLIKEGFIQQDKSNRSAAIYSCGGVDAGDGVLNIHNFFFTERFTYKTKEGQEKTERLTKAEVRILHKILMQRTFRRSERQLARDLNLGLTTVSTGLKKLCDIGLINCNEKGTCTGKTSVYRGVKRKLDELYAKYAMPTPPKEEGKAPAEKPSGTVYMSKEKKAYIAAINEKSERETFYARRKREAEAKAEKVLDIAMRNIKFAETVQAINKLQPAIARAEIAGDGTAESLRRMEASLESRKRRLLSEMGIKAEQLKPHYACKKCSDKGFLPNGKGCDCYTKWRRMSK